MQYRRFGWLFTTFLLVFVNQLSAFGASPANRSITRLGFRRLYISRLFRRNLGRLPIYHGVRLEAELDGQAVQPIINSLRPTNTIIGGYQFGFSLHTRQAGLWSGGHFVFAILNVVTSGNPDVAIGDIQGVSSLYEQTRSRFHDIYFRQNVPFGVFRIGIMNGSDFFDVTGLATSLQNLSFNLTPTIGDNVAGFSHTGAGFMIRLKARSLVWRVGLYQGDPVQTFDQPFDRGAIGFLEVDRTWRNASREITVKAGVWHYWQHRRLRSTLGPSVGGVYGIAEWRDIPIRRYRLGFFAQVAGNPESRGPISSYLGFGGQFSGFWAQHRRDALSFGIARAWLNTARTMAETTEEVAFVAHLPDRMIIEPDLQWIIHANGGPRNALVAILGAGVAF